MSRGFVLYVGAFELPDKNASANRVVSNGKIFVSLGYSVAFLGVTREGSFNGIRRTEGDFGVMFERAYPKGTRQWIKNIFDISDIEEAVSMLDNVRLIVLYDVPFENAKRVKKLCKKHGIALAYDCAEWNDYAEGNFLKRKYKKIDEKAIENKLDRLCDNLIVISRCMQRKYSRCENLVLLPPLVDSENEIWHQKPVCNDKFEFFFAGELGGNKETFENVVKAFHQLYDTDCILRIIGVEKKDFIRLYPECGKMCSSDRRIIFMGRLPHTETVKYELGADCMIFIRQSDKRNEAGFSTKFVEATTCNIPTITTNVSDVGEYIGKRIDGIIIPNVDVENIKRAMISAKSRFMSRKNTKRPVTDIFDYRNYIEPVEEWLERIFGQ